MHPNQSKLESRVHRAAEAALSRQKYVSAIDVLCGMGLLATPHVDDWRKGRVDFLERVIQANLSKISSSMAIFRRWAGEKGLKPSETGYVRHTRGGTMALQFSKSGDPGIEKSYRTHYLSPALSEKKQQRLQEKLNQSPKPVVFQNLREAQCSECGAEIEQGSLLSMELKQLLCLQCARLDDLEFLPSGDTALTKRATKYSGRVAVAVYLRTSRYLPPRWEAVRDAMPALFDLLESEKEPSVRAVLGHWMFGYIHPYPDGNGRMARFLMNVMPRTWQLVFQFPPR